MAEKLSERIINQRLEQALALAKKGQYNKARYMLDDIQSHPRAKKLLKQMDGRNDKMTGGLSYFYSGTLIAMVAFGILVLLFLFNFIGNVQTGIQDNTNMNEIFTERGMQGNVEEYADLVEFCYDRVGDTRESCLDWGQLVMTEHNPAVFSCVLVTDEGIQYRGRELDVIATCYSEAGIPDPS